MSPTEPGAEEGARARAYRDSVAEPIERPFAEALVGRSLVAAGHRALDVPCGTGLVARRVVPVVGAAGSVTGVDADPARLELAGEDGEAVVWIESDTDTLPFEAASFDAALSCHGLDRSEAPTRTLSEIRRVLRLGGRVSLAVWSAAERNPFFRAVDAAVRRSLDGVDGSENGALTSWARMFELGDAERLKTRLEEAGFVMVTVEELRLDLELPPLAAFLPAYLHAVGLGEALGAVEPEERETRLAALEEAFEAELDGDLPRNGEERHPDGIRLPFRSLLAFGRAWRA